MGGPANRRDEQQDREAAQSFPASDPPSGTPVAGTGSPDKGAGMEESHQPKGQPTDDRLASETASAKIQGVQPAQTDHR